jgi:hypothetical protein
MVEEVIEVGVEGRGEEGSWFIWPVSCYTLLSGCLLEDHRPAVYMSDDDEEFGRKLVLKGVGRSVGDGRKIGRRGA